MPATFEQISALIPRMAALEAEEPLVSLWRCNSGKPSSMPAWFQAAQAVRDLGFRLQAPQRPEPGQVVMLSYAATPSTIETQLATMRALHRQGHPPFFVYTRRTEFALKENLHRGSAFLPHIVARAPLSALASITRRANALVSRMVEILGEELAASARVWLPLAMRAEAAARQWLPGAGALVADHDNEALRKGFFTAARGAGVPSLILQHGTLDESLFPVHCDEFLCWSDYFRRQAEQWGLPQMRTAVVGSPRWDSLFAERGRPADPAVRAAMGGRDGIPLVLLLSQGHVAQIHPEYFEPLFAGITRLLVAGYDICIKLHPAEADASAYRARIPTELFSRVRTLPSSIPLAEAIRASDVSCHAFSAASMEATILGQPILFQQPRGGIRISDFPDLGGGTWVTPDNVATICRALAFPSEERTRAVEQQDRFLSTMLANHGTASDAAARYILSRAASVSARGVAA